MRRALLLMCFAASTLSAAEGWPGVKFTEARAYAWPAGRDEEQVILKDMTLRADVLNKDGAVLSAEQIKTVVGAVTGKHPSHPVAACYEPHNAIVFYDAGKPVAFIEICFSCLGRRISPAAGAVPSTEPIHFKALKELFRELRLPMGEKAAPK